jgi:tetratricopeptide (TPR) repeat protein
LLLLQNKQYDQGLAKLEKAVDLDVTDSEVHFVLGGASYEQLSTQSSLAQIDKAIVHLRIALELGTLSTESVGQARAALASIYCRRASERSKIDATLAVEDLLFSLTFDSENARTHWYLGIEYVRLGKKTEALVHLNNAIASNQLSGPDLDAVMQTRASIQ